MVARASIIAAAAVLFFAAQARADDEPLFSEPKAEADGGPAIGIGVICDTSEQAEHYVSLRAAGTDGTAAMMRINKEANRPGACGIAAIAYVPDKTMHTMTLKGRLVAIVRVTVVAGYDGRGWHRVLSGNVQYAIVAREGLEI